MIRYLLLAVVAILVLSLIRRLRGPQEGRHLRPLPSAPRALIDGGGVALLHDGLSSRVDWADLQSVHIEGVASGPHTDDVVWVLTPRGGGAPVRVAQTAPGAEAMIARLQQLPGFRYDPMIQRPSPTESTPFLVWERPAD